MATEEKDPLAIQIFHSAGMQLGRHVKGLVPKADKVGVSGGVQMLEWTGTTGMA